MDDSYEKETYRQGQKETETRVEDPMKNQINFIKFVFHIVDEKKHNEPSGDILDKTHLRGKGGIA